MFLSCYKYKLNTCIAPLRSQFISSGIPRVSVLFTYEGKIQLSHVTLFVFRTMEVHNLKVSEIPSDGTLK